MDLLGLEVNIGGFVTEALGFTKVFIWLLIPAGLIGFVFWILQFKYEIDVVHLTGSTPIRVRDKARKVKDKQGVEKLKLKKTKERIAMPPDEVCVPNIRGKISCSVYRTQSGQYIWRKDKGLDKKIQLPDGAIVEDFVPLNTMNRSFYANEWEEAQKYKTSNIWDTIKNIAPIMGLVIIAVMMMVYWGDLTGPVKEIQEEHTKQLDIQQDIAEKQSRMMSQLVREYVPEDAQIPTKNATSDG